MRNPQAVKLIYDSLRETAESEEEGASEISDLIKKVLDGSLEKSLDIRNAATRVFSTITRVMKITGVLDTFMDCVEWVDDAAGSWLWVRNDSWSNWDKLAPALGLLMQYDFVDDRDTPEWIIEYADTCDKLRIGEFGGGVFVVRLGGWTVLGAKGLYVGMNDTNFIDVVDDALSSGFWSFNDVRTQTELKTFVIEENGIV